MILYTDIPSLWDWIFPEREVLEARGAFFGALVSARLLTASEALALLTE